MAPPRASGKAATQPKKSVVETIQNIKEATGADEDDIRTMLAACDYDVNEATNALIERK
jgi:hypothetical protein